MPLDMETLLSTAGEVPPVGRRVALNDPVYSDIVYFLHEEAAMLDEDRHREWLGVMAEDVEYRAPLRDTVYRRDGRGFDLENSHFNDDLSTLKLRVRRSVEIPSAWDRDPAPRVRRFLSNICVYQTDLADEYAVISYALVLRNRLDNPQYDMFSAKREDVIRRTREGLKLARRLVLIDQSSLGASFLNLFM